MRPHFLDTHEGCVNGCDSTLCEVLQVNISRTSLPFSNTQSTNRNTITNQNIGKIILTFKSFSNSYIIINKIILIF